MFICTYRNLFIPYDTIWKYFNQSNTSSEYYSTRRWLMHIDIKLRQKIWQEKRILKSTSWFIHILFILFQLIWHVSCQINSSHFFTSIIVCKTIPTKKCIITAFQDEICQIFVKNGIISFNKKFIFITIHFLKGKRDALWKK